MSETQTPFEAEATGDRAQHAEGPYKAGYLDGWGVDGEGSFSHILILREGDNLPAAFVVAELCDDDEIAERKDIVIEALNAHHETGLTPRDLATQRAKLAVALQRMFVAYVGVQGVHPGAIEECRSVLKEVFGEHILPAFGNAEGGAA